MKEETLKSCLFCTGDLKVWEMRDGQWSTICLRCGYRGPTEISYNQAVALHNKMFDKLTSRGL